MGLDSKRLIEGNGGEGEKEGTGGSRKLSDWGCKSDSSKERGPGGKERCYLQRQEDSTEEQALLSFPQLTTLFSYHIFP